MIDEYYKNKIEYAKIGSGRMRGIKKLLGDYAHITILDIGCGQGVLGKNLKTEKSVTIHGIDISPRSVAIAEKVLDKAYCLNLEDGGGLKKILEQQHYDTIIMSEVLEHLFYPEKVLETIAQNITPTTKIIITVPNILYWKNRLKIFLGYFDYKNEGLMDRGHIHFFSWKSLQELVAKEGFKITSIANNVPDSFLKPFGNIFPGLVSFQFIISAEKNLSFLG